MNELREKLHQAIDEYGISDKRTIAISQELDKLIYKEQKDIPKKLKVRPNKIKQVNYNRKG